MMKNTKRIISLLLTLTMVLTTINLSVFTKNVKASNEMPFVVPEYYNEIGSTYDKTFAFAYSAIHPNWIKLVIDDKEVPADQYIYTDNRYSIPSGGTVIHTVVIKGSYLKDLELGAHKIQAYYPFGDSFEHSDTTLYVYEKIVNANDFMFKLSEVDGLDKGKILSLSNAKGVTNPDVLRVFLDVEEHNIEKAPGEYSVTISALYSVQGVKKVVKCTVYDDAQEDPINKEILTANDFMLSKADVNIEDTKLIELARAKAMSTIDGSTVAVLVQDRTKLKAEIGTYDVTFKTAKGTSVTVKCQVYDETADNPDAKENEKIFANNFTLSLSEAKNVSNDTLKSRSHVKAVSTEDGRDIPITEVTHNILDKVGTYDVTFKTAKGTSVTVKCQVYDDTKEDPANEERITANNFKLGISSVKNITDEQMIELAHAKAYSVKDGSSVPITQVFHRIGKGEPIPIIIPKTLGVCDVINGKIGTYDVTFKT